MADTSGPAGQVGGQFGVTRGDHRPAVDKNLGTNLFGHHFTIQSNRAAPRGLNAILQVQIGGVFSGVTQPPPPQDCTLFDDIVEPGLTDLGRSQIEAVAVVGQGTQEGESTGDIIVGDNERLV